MVQIVNEKTAKKLAKRYRPVFIQEVKSVLDYLSPINLGNFIIVDRPTIYYKVMQHGSDYYIFYMTYHYRDWSEWPPPFRKFDEHRHDNEGVLLAVCGFTKEIEWVASRAHGSIEFVKNGSNSATGHMMTGISMDRGEAWFEIEAGGHGIYPISQSTINRQNNHIFYKDYKLVNMERPKVKNWLNNTVFPIFEKEGVSPPNKWNDTKLQRKEGFKTDGLIFTNPPELIRLAKKHKLI